MKPLLMLLLSGVVASGLAVGQSSVTSTKHNLSISGTGTIKAQTEQEVCIFCHTPHHASAAAQLWNHLPTSQSYTLYSSTYLTSRTYPAPNQPNAKSKLCMSCHDGTIALGSVYNTSGSGTTGSIQMSGGVTTMPAGIAANLGTALTNDHPVGFGYDPARDPELVVRAWPWNTPVKLDPDASNGRVECHTCHDPHNNTNTHFLAASNADAALCRFCHVKTGWTVSVHDVSTQAYTPSGESPTTIGEWACRNCHRSHTGGGTPYLLQLSEENTCYQAGCHGTSPGTSTKNIQSAANKTYAHPVNTLSGKHLNPDNATSLNVPNRHAECYDCHDTHQAQDGLHAARTNAASSVLKGVWGVTPGSATIWTTDLLHGHQSGDAGEPDLFQMSLVLWIWGGGEWSDVHHRTLRYEYHRPGDGIQSGQPVRASRAGVVEQPDGLRDTEAACHRPAHDILGEPGDPDDVLF
jgi:predicted CXXCH cytochrome family protein